MNHMKKLTNRIALIVLTTLPLSINAFADDSNKTMEQQFTELNKLNIVYAKCNTVATGSGITDKAAQTGLSKTFFSEMLKNHKKMVKLGLEGEPEAFNFFLELMTADMLAAFFMGTNIVEVNGMVKKDMESLYEKYNFDWKLVHTELWETYKCNEVYSKLK